MYVNIKLVKLARELRECDGIDGKGSNTGLSGLEVLTLPYSNDRYEVACNLLRSSEENGNTNAILKAVEDWEIRMLTEFDDAKNYGGDIMQESLVESAYRVGTTEEMCLR